MLKKGTCKVFSSFILLVVILITISGCNSIEKSIGNIYSIEEAYDKGLLTVEDLQSISYYHNGSDDEMYVPIPKNPEVLTENTENAIKETVAYIMRNSGANSIDHAKAEDFTIEKYYGTYNDCVAFMINDPYHDYPAVDLDITETIAGVSFHYSNPQRILVWEDETSGILRQFDLTDPKELWEGTIDDEFEIDRVVVIMKKTTVYPVLELRHFGLSNGESLEYDWFRGETPNFRQILTIYLKQHGKDKVIEAIRILEKLEFVKTVEPKYIFGTQDD